MRDAGVFVMMTTEAKKHETPELQTLLARDHQRLDALFERLLAAFHADAHAQLGPLWTEFDSRLRGHIALEEEHILPEFARIDPAEARELAKEHMRIRKLLSERDIAGDLHLAREETIRDLVTLLRAHAKREDDLMYRWAANHLDAAEQRTIVAQLRSALGKLVGNA
jgi:hemerythrin HHE cation binding domain-containing protein